MKQYRTDVAVVAGGCAGLTAAVAAAEKGAQVVVLEKTGDIGGAAVQGTGLFAVETQLQKKYMIGLTKEEAFQKFMDYTHWRVDARLVRDYIEKSPDTIEWLEKMGVEFSLPTRFFRDGDFTWHLVSPGNPTAGSAGKSKRIVECLKKRADSLGVRFLFETTGKKLIRENGEVVGVMAEDKDGEVRVDSKAVILATGGFGGSPELIKKYTGFEWGKNLFTFRRPQNSGDGIRMAREAGAAPTRPIMELTLNLPMRGDYPAAGMMFNQPCLLVNLQGERIMDEEVFQNGTYASNEIAQQKDGCAFMLLDAETARHYIAHGADHHNNVSGDVSLDTFFGEMEEASKNGDPALFSADSLEELAAKAGIEAKRLLETVEEYNGYCKTGVDSYFGKSHRSLFPVKKPKFYAGKFFPGGYGSTGGIKINHRTEVIDEASEPIHGLYAAGMDACNIYGDSYTFVLPGNTMGFAVNSGRISGENAAEYGR